VNVYDFSIKRQQIAPKKVFSIDTGLINAVGFSFSPNTGKLLENLVYLTLRRKTPEVYYLVTPASYEVDFYLPQTRELIRVSQDLTQPATRTRETRALFDAMRELSLTRSMILSETNAPPIEENGLTIEIRLLVDWLLIQ
jgi:hypothetical protein